MLKNNPRMSLCVFILSAFVFGYPAFAFAEIKVFEKETTLKAAHNQSQEQEERLAVLEAQRIVKQRQMLDRIKRTLAEQERAKRDEAAALAAEQDQIKRAHLENEQLWNDLARKAQLMQDQWVVIDDSLFLRQAVTEVNDMKQEIANLKGRLDYQYGENTRNLQAAYARQRALTKAKLPPKPAPKDAFETTMAYNKRISAYGRKVKEAAMGKGKDVEKLKAGENLRLTQAKSEYLGQQIRVLEPFIKRLQDLQDRKFTLPEGGAMTVDLGEPDADNNRFPVRLQHSGKSWSIFWNYTDINMAKDFYRTRTYLKAEGLFQIEEAAILNPKLTAARVTHSGTKETREFGLETPKILTEIDQFVKIKQEAMAALEASKLAERLLARKEIGKDGRFIAYDDETVLDRGSGLIWAAKDNGSDINWQGAKSYCENYRGGGYTDWRMPTQEELAGLYDKTRSYTSACGDDAHLTALIRFTCYWVWASETRDSKAACFRFGGGGYRCWGPPSGSKFSRILPVRSGKTAQNIP